MSEKKRNSYLEHHVVVGEEQTPADKQFVRDVLLPLHNRSDSLVDVLASGEFSRQEALYLLAWAIKLILSSYVQEQGVAAGDDYVDYQGKRAREAVAVMNVYIETDGHDNIDGLAMLVEGILALTAGALHLAAYPQDSHLRH